MIRGLLRCYACLFALAALVFVAFEGLTLRVISWAGSWAGYPPLAPAGPSLWLGLTGSLMAVIAWLAFRLSEDPAQPAAWEALLLSKSVSAALFLIMSAAARQPLLAWSALVDFSILVHLFWLRRAYEDERGPAPRLALRRGRFHETWFARFNDAETRRAVWLRYLCGRGQTRCQATFFDPASGRVVSRGWSAPAALSDGPELFLSKEAGLSFDRMWGSGDGSSWDLRWSKGALAGAAIVPAWLRAAGLTRSGYDDEAPAAWFDGSASVDGQIWRFANAPGCVGHVWGESQGKGWWWAHALFGKGGADATLELLSAPGPLGLRLTSAVLWLEGRRLESNGPLGLLRNRSRRRGERWLFRARFPGGLVAEGECSLGLAAALRYDDPPGRPLLCRNSKVSSMRLRLRGGGRREELATEAAAVEFVEPDR